MNKRDNSTAVLRWIVFSIIILSFALLIYGTSSDWSSWLKSALHSRPSNDSPGEAEASPTPAPTPEEVLTAGDLARVLKLHSNRAAEPAPAGKVTTDSKQTPVPRATPGSPEKQPSPSKPEVPPIDFSHLAKADCPAEVRINRPVPFPLFLNGNKVGELTAPAGLVVKVLNVNAPLVETEFRNSKAWIPMEWTDLIARVSAARNSPADSVTTTPIPGAEVPLASPASSGNTVILRVALNEPEDTSGTNFNNVQKALEAAATNLSKGNVRVQFMGGKFTEGIRWAAPQGIPSGRSLILESVPAGTVVTSALNDQPLFAIAGGVPVTVRGFKLEGSNAPAIKIDGAALVTIEQCLLKSCSHGVAALNAARISLVDSVVLNNRESQLLQSSGNAAWEIRGCTIAATDPSNLGTLVDGIPGTGPADIRIERCTFYHPTLKNAFRRPDASLINMLDWQKLVHDNGSTWSKEQAETNAARPTVAQ